MSPQDHIEAKLPSFLKLLGIQIHVPGIVSAHGDKVSQYNYQLEEANIALDYGYCLLMLTYLTPYDRECRETDTGWVSPISWVIANKTRFESAWIQSQ